jgi:branched-chain amino acid transport system ATP-binding protein
MPESALQVAGLVVEYHRGMPVVKDVGLQVAPAEVVGLFGRNGAGKSTTLRAIFRLVPRIGGEITVLGRVLGLGGRAHQVVRLGATMVMEGRGIFADLTVEENLRAAASSADYAALAKRAFDQFPMLAPRRKTAAGRLSGGEQQLLAIARAGMLRPRLLVVDEPSLGLSPAATLLVLQALRELARQGSAVLVADQNVTALGPTCDRAIVMEAGTVVMQMSRDQLIANPESVEDIYLGKE